MLSDVFPTGWHATRLADLKPGESVVIYGAGPVGQMTAMSARIQGASQIFVVDGHEDRPELARMMGATPIDTRKGNLRESILELTNGLGGDCGAECVGYQCQNSEGKEVPNLVMDELVSVVKATGTLGVIGVFIPVDKGAKDELANKGQIAFDFGKFWMKGLKWLPGSATSKPTIGGLET